MPDQVALVASPRPGDGKGEARQLRREGRVPAVAYGRSLDATPVSVDALELYHALHTDAGANAIIRLDIDGDAHLALAREIQRHPVRRDVLHVDFVTVDRNVKVTVDIPIELVGEAPGASEGGVVDQVRFSVPVEVLPLDVPDQLTLDVSGLQIGDVLRLADVNVPDGAEILEDEAFTVVTCNVPTGEVEEATATEVIEGDAGPIAAEDVAGSAGDEA